MLKHVKKLICKHKGHNWDKYSFQTGYWSYDVEMAGECKRCGFNTHERVEEYKY